MSGHSKWKQIKNKKGAADVKRGKLFSQISKLITVSARTGQNLDMVIGRAKAANMPADNIDRAIKKGTGELNDGTQIEALAYEAYGPGGAGLIVSVLTDNRNRSLGELKTVFNKLGGRLAETGSVQYQFNRKGAIEVPVPAGTDREALELKLIEEGAEDMQDEEEQLVVLVEPTELATVREALKAAGVTVTDAKLVNVAKLAMKLSDEDEAKLLKLMEAIDELDDVESVETNADLAA